MKPLYLTENASETEELGALLAAELATGALPPFVALYGDLGVGKTAFVRGVARVLAPGAAVRSPTFALVNEYKGGKQPIYHFDMYRITDEDDLYSIGYDDYIASGRVCLVEWSENIPYAIPAEHVRVTIEKLDPTAPDKRKISIEAIKETSC